MTAHHIDATSSSGPISENTLADFKIINTRHLEQIIISRGIHIQKSAIPDDNVVTRTFKTASIIDVDAIACLANHCDVFYVNVRNIRKMKCLATPLEEDR